MLPWPHLWLGKLTERQVLYDPRFFSFGSHNWSHRTFQGYTGAPRYIGKEQTNLAGNPSYKKARASIPEADNIQERAPQGLQKTPHSQTFRLLIAAAAAAKLLQSCPTLCDPTDSSPPGYPVPGILQARTLEWVAISFSNA